MSEEEQLKRWHDHKQQWYQEEYYRLRGLLIECRDMLDTLSSYACDFPEWFFEDENYIDIDELVGRLEYRE